MKYLIGKSKYSGNVYAGLVPHAYHLLEPESNRVWEKEITKEEFDSLKLNHPEKVLLSGTECEIYIVEGYNGQH